MTEGVDGQRGKVKEGRIEEETKRKVHKTRKGTVQEGYKKEGGRQPTRGTQGHIKKKEERIGEVCEQLQDNCTSGRCWA